MIIKNFFSEFFPWIATQALPTNVWSQLQEARNPEASKPGRGGWITFSLPSLLDPEFLFAFDGVIKNHCANPLTSYKILFVFMQMKGGNNPVTFLPTITFKGAPSHRRFTELLGVILTRARSLQDEYPVDLDQTVVIKLLPSVGPSTNLRKFGGIEGLLVPNLTNYDIYMKQCQDFILKNPIVLGSRTNVGS